MMEPSLSIYALKTLQATFSNPLVPLLLPQCLDALIPTERQDFLRFLRAACLHYNRTEVTLSQVNEFNLLLTSKRIQPNPRHAHLYDPRRIRLAEDVLMCPMPQKTTFPASNIIQVDGKIYAVGKQCLQELIIRKVPYEPYCGYSYADEKLDLSGLVIENVAMSQNLIGFIDREKKLYLMPRMESNHSKKTEKYEVNSVYASNQTKHPIIFFSALSDTRWVVITRNKFQVYDIPMGESSFISMLHHHPKEFRILNAEIPLAKKALALTYPYFLLQMEACLLVLRLDCTTRCVSVTSKVYNDVPLIDISYSQRWETVFAADMSAYMMKLQFEPRFGQMGEEGIHFDQSHSHNINATLQKQKISTQVDLSEGTAIFLAPMKESQSHEADNKHSSQHQPNKSSQNHALSLYTKPNRTKATTITYNRNLIGQLAIYDSFDTLITYESVPTSIKRAVSEQKEVFMRYDCKIKLWDIRHMHVYQVVECSSALERIVLSNEGLVVIAKGRGHVGIYPLAKEGGSITQNSHTKQTLMPIKPQSDYLGLLGSERIGINSHNVGNIAQASSNSMKNKLISYQLLNNMLYLVSLGHSLTHNLSTSTVSVLQLSSQPQLSSLVTIPLVISSFAATNGQCYALIEQTQDTPKRLLISDRMLTYTNTWRSLSGQNSRHNKPAQGMKSEKSHQSSPNRHNENIGYLPSKQTNKTGLLDIPFIPNNESPSLVFLQNSFRYDLAIWHEGFVKLMSDLSQNSFTLTAPKQSRITRVMTNGTAAEEIKNPEEKMNLTSTVLIAMQAKLGTEIFVMDTETHRLMASIKTKPAHVLRYCSDLVIIRGLQPHSPLEILSIKKKSCLALISFYRRSKGKVNNSSVRRRYTLLDVSVKETKQSLYICLALLMHSVDQQLLEQSQEIVLKQISLQRPTCKETHAKKMTDSILDPVSKANAVDSTSSRLEYGQKMGRQGKSRQVASTVKVDDFNKSIQITELGGIYGIESKFDWDGTTQLEPLRQVSLEDEAVWNTLVLTNLQESTNNDQKQVHKRITPSQCTCSIHEYEGFNGVFILSNPVLKTVRIGKFNTHKFDEIAVIGLDGNQPKLQKLESSFKKTLRNQWKQFITEAINHELCPINNQETKDILAKLCKTIKTPTCQNETVGVSKHLKRPSKTSLPVSYTPHSYNSMFKKWHIQQQIKAKSHLEVPRLVPEDITLPSQESKVALLKAVQSTIVIGLSSKKINNSPTKLIGLPRPPNPQASSQSQSTIVSPIKLQKRSKSQREDKSLGSMNHGYSMSIDKLSTPQKYLTFAKEQLEVSLKKIKDSIQTQPTVSSKTHQTILKQVNSLMKHSTLHTNEYVRRKLKTQF